MLFLLEETAFDSMVVLTLTYLFRYFTSHRQMGHYPEAGTGWLTEYNTLSDKTVLQQSGMLPFLPSCNRFL